MNSLSLRFIVLTWFLTVQCILLAQNPSSWINFGREYYKVTLATDGAYRLSYSDLQNAGFPVGTVDPRRIQLYHRGVEQSIIVQGQSDAQFDPSDYIEFYGKRNDGVNDTKLYTSPAYQPHTYYNLYSDTSAYFLTWNQGLELGKRMTSFSEVNVGGIPADTYQFNNSLTVYSNEYSPGNTVNTFLQHTQFDEGEGWTGSTICVGTSGCTGQLDLTINNLTGVVGSGPVPQLEMVLVGRDEVSHLSEIYVGPNSGALRLLTTKSFSNFQIAQVMEPLLFSDISVGGQLVVRVKALGVGGTRDRLSVSYINVTYPQNFEMNLQTKKWIVLQEYVSDKSYIEISSPPANLSLWDITDDANIVTIGTTPAGPNVSAIIPNTASQRTLFAKSGFSTPVIKRIHFRQIQPANHDYLIISNRALMQPGLEYANPVRAYGAYRASPEGGAYDTLVVTVDMLYNQFNFGESSSLAIYEFMKYMVDNGDPKYLFLIGKGLNVSNGFFRKTIFGPNDYKDLVPSAGMPGSDMAYTAGLGSTTFEPAVPTGRITASNPNEVAAYLNKVKEADALPFDVLWRKQLLHLSGGIQPQELIIFKEYMDGFGEVAKGPYYGGTLKTIAKQEPNPVELINISEEVNNGVNFITFFGHSSSSTIDIDIGFVTDPIMGYDNPSKYPGFLINGCNAGAFFANSKVFGEDWILAAEKGARSFIAHSSFGFTSTLRTYSQLFYETGFGDSTFVRKGIGDIQKEVARRYLTISSPNISTVTQIQQMVLLGDPAVKLFGALKPDYEIENSSLHIESFNDSPVTALSDSFALKIIAKNFGSASKLPLKVRVTRTFNDNASINYDTVYTSPGSLDTLTVVMRREADHSGFGQNQFHIILDYENQIDELDEENNEAQLNVFVPLTGTKNLIPYPFGIVSDTDVKLKFQNTNLISGSRSYDLEVDTVDTFDSPFLKQFVVEGSVLMEQSIGILSEDSLAYYWRTRLSEPLPGENTEWALTSFTYINNGNEGWAQVHFPQLNDNAVNGLVKDPVLRKLDFIETEASIFINNYGSSHPSPSTTSFKINNEEYNLATQGQPCRSNTINFVSFDKTTLVPYAGIPFIFQDPKTCGRSPQVINSFRTNELETGLGNDVIQMIDNINLSDSVVIFSIGNAGYGSWSANVITKLGELGIAASQIAALQAGEPVVILGKKGAASGTATVITSGIAPENEQELQVNEMITGKYSTGSLRSPLIGPATAWDEFTVYLRGKGPSDHFSIDIYGIQITGEEQLLFDDVVGNVDLSSVDATVYPWLKFVLTASDEVNLDPVQFHQWVVEYTPGPEGLLVLLSDPTPVEIPEGEAWEVDYAFMNISDKNFPAELTVNFETLNKTNLTSESNEQVIESPLPGEATQFSFTVDTNNKTGPNDVKVVVNNRLVPEQFYENNTLTLIDHLNVLGDNIVPVLDVTFDGRYIANGDYVSPNPAIVAKVWDENNLILKTDTIGIRIFLRSPCIDEDCPLNPIYFSRPDVSWTPAAAGADFSIQFLPAFVEEGNYALRIEIEDGSGNKSLVPYEINFVIDFENEIKFFDPYPTPSSGDVFFTFTASGQQAPDHYQLQIFGLDGRLIKSYDEQSSFLHIGTNKIVWNGENEYGTIQNGGLYLYRFQVTSSGNTFVRNGKIVLIR